jgi:Zn-dependent protease
MPSISEFAYGIVWYLLFVISVTIHEAAHAWAAKRGGDLTAYEGGQVSLNPIPHMKRAPWGMVVIPIISVFLIGWPFGYASTPYNADWAYNHPKKAAWMGCAGPAANLLIVLVCLALVRIGILAGIFLEPYSVGLKHIVDPNPTGNWQGLITFISMLFSLNLILLVLNLIPLPPLDGSSVVSLFLHDDAARKYNQVVSNPFFGFIGLLVAWQLFNPLFNWFFPFVMNVVYWGAGFA